ncbi:MAG: methionine adenosyltransferase [Patescibacteria group bacterium]
MSNIFLCHKNFKDEFVEFVERKGAGHPDTLSDALAERLSSNYSRYTLEKYGAILHHNFDKVGLLGGSSYVSFGEGYLTDPIRILLNGRVSICFGNERIPVEELLTKWTEEFFIQKLPMISVDKDLDIRYNVSSQSSPGETEDESGKSGTRKYWFCPRNFADIQELSNLLSNDTSLGVGYAPRTDLENLVLDIERRLNSESFKEYNSWIGSDIKILGFRNHKKYMITICIPQIANFVENAVEYKKNLKKARKEIFNIAEKNNVKDLDLNINTRDNLQTMELYLTAIGSSIESGDEGLVGRGNRVGGVIPVMKPLSMEGACGKNPVYHVGKLYYVAAEKIANDVNGEFGIPVEIFLASQSGRDLVDPWIVLVRVPYGFDEAPKLKNYVENRLKSIPELTQPIIDEDCILY